MNGHDAATIFFDRKHINARNWIIFIAKQFISSSNENPVEIISHTHHECIHNVQCAYLYSIYCVCSQSASSMHDICNDDFVGNVEVRSISPPFSFYVMCKCLYRKIELCTKCTDICNCGLDMFVFTDLIERLLWNHATYIVHSQHTYIFDCISNERKHPVDASKYKETLLLLHSEIWPVI